MLTIQTLKEHGVNTEEGVSRCMGNEGFYLRMVDMAMADRNYEKLRDAVQQNDKKAAFEAAHSLKGVLANLSFTPILEPVIEITELLRAGADADYGPIVETILEKKKEFENL